MSGSAAGRRNIFRKLRRAASCRRGVAALEFALIAPVLFILIMGVIETGLVYYAQFVLKNAVSNTARILRTNQDTSLTTVSALKSYICETQGANAVLSDCTENLYVVSAAFNSVLSSYGSSDFQSAVNASSLNESGNLYSSVTSYADDGSVATECNVVYLRVLYPWTVITPGLSWFLVNYGDNKRVLSVTEVFRNEPSGTSECDNTE